MPAARTEPPIVSIVIATYARFEPLKQCIAAIRDHVSLPLEVIVVGGAATDGTADWASRQTDLQFVRETRREGCTRAYNKGFRVATGRYIMWLNDDSRPRPGAVEAAVQMIERPDMCDVGLVAFYHTFTQPRNRLDTITREGREYSIYHVRGHPYANFGLLRRDLLARLGYLDERYYFCGWDPDLSLKVQFEAGLKVVGCPDALIDHDELIDDRKTLDLRIFQRDNDLLFRKWKLPEKNAYPDPAPAYRRASREHASA